MKRNIKIEDEYGAARNALFSDYDGNRQVLFAKYRSRREHLFKLHAEVHDRLEWDHGEQILPIDFGLQLNQEVIDKDIACDHAQPLNKFEAGRLEADHEFFVVKLQSLYREYSAERNALDREYQAARTSLYGDYRAKRDGLDAEAKTIMKRGAL